VKSTKYKLSRLKDLSQTKSDICLFDRRRQVLCCTYLCYALLHCVVLCCAVHLCVALCCAVLCCAMRCDAMRCRLCCADFIGLWAWIVTILFLCRIQLVLIPNEATCLSDSGRWNRSSSPFRCHMEPKYAAQTRNFNLAPKYDLTWKSRFRGYGWALINFRKMYSKPYNVDGLCTYSL
jgi:hypothetical protein